LSAFPASVVPNSIEPDPGWERITWDEALALTASRLGEIRAQYGPEAVVFGCATGAGTSSADFFP
jgi:predicted molibdopterin-dependent oxidoreductase YjgC